MYSLESPQRGDSNEYTQHTIIVQKLENITKLSPFASWPGVMINPQWLEPPISRTNFPGPKGVRAIEVRLYMVPQKVYLKIIYIWQGLCKIGAKTAHSWNEGKSSLQQL